ncbi:response regulator [Maridesulfovibrio bastinii]|uniref:response regulator n=1 Tax=Maridesulfovibrio bastinii TaxID=47157 RepID=UPI00042862F5|nr:response regulator [Maridesulfovibrio bastinii]
MRALIAEDEFLGRKLLSNFLDPLFDTDIVVNGREALEAYELSIEEQRPYDLVLMDIMMPEMDGLTALEKIRELEADKKIEKKSVVIMTTALSDPKTVIRSFHDAEASAYIVKPVEKSKLYEELEKVGLLSK